jgi:hypothetical protein
MNSLGILIIVAGPAFAIVWLVAEFKAERAWRIALGLISMVILTTVAAVATVIVGQLNYNSYYGFAAKSLIEETIKGLESGQTSSVLKELHRLQLEYQPTYENRARFAPLVEATIERLKQASEEIPLPDSAAKEGRTIRSEANQTSLVAGDTQPG